MIKKELRVKYLVLDYLRSITSLPKDLLTDKRNRGRVESYFSLFPFPLFRKIMAVFNSSNSEHVRKSPAQHHEANYHAPYLICRVYSTPLFTHQVICSYMTSAARLHLLCSSKYSSKGPAQNVMTQKLRVYDIKSYAKLEKNKWQWSN